MNPIQLFFIILLVLATLYSFLQLDTFVANHNMALPFEGFSNVSSLQSNHAFDRQQNYNPVGLSLIASGTEGALGSSADPLMTTLGSSTTYPLSSDKSGLFATIAMCEAVKTNTSGSPFDNPEFAAKCGICLDIGTDSNGNPTTGGLVLLENDRNVAKAATLRNAIPNYKPTVGTCPANRFVSTKAEWERLTKQLKCERQGSYDLDECSQCYDDQSYTTVDQSKDGGVVAGTGTLYVTGTGTLSYIEQGFGTGSTTLSSTPYVIRLQGPETTRVTITVTGTAANPAKLAGYLSGSTQSGLFTIDLYRLVLTDTVTGRKPRTERPKTINGIQASIMGPGFGKQQMVLSINMPFTFVDTSSEEAGHCLTSPFITKRESAEFLNSDPCYSKGSGPGKFNLDCLQALFLSNGCTDQGRGYPKDTISASDLMAPYGTSLSLSDIATYIYNAAVAASTGRSSNGRKLVIWEWSDASQFCTGKILTSPCDADPNTDSGPLSTECLSFLWTNGGTNPSNSAYNPTSNATSLSSTGTQYCQLSGSLSPIDENGKVNNSAISYWQGQGGLNAVKAEINNIHSQANAIGLSDAARLPYLTKCYGITNLAPAPVASSMDLPDLYTCKKDTMIGKLNVTKDFTLSFDITPTSGPANNWASIIHFTTGMDCCDLGSRAPGIWFAPNTLNEFAVHVGHSTDGSWACRPSLSPSSPDYIQEGKTTSFRLTCKGSSITVSLGSSVFNYSHDGSRFKGFVSVYGGDIWYQNAKVNISNLTYVPM